MFEKIKNLFIGTPDHTNEFFAGDINTHKTVSGLAYILFFIPLITDNGSGYARFHANQGLLLLIACIICSIISSVLGFFPFIGWLLKAVFGLVTGLALFVMFVLGLVNGFSGRAKELPFIGGIKIIK